MGSRRVGKPAASARSPVQRVLGQARSYFGALVCIRMLIMRNVAFTAAIT